MNKDQYNMFSVKLALERIVHALIASHQKSDGAEDVLYRQINETLHAFVASGQLKAFKFSEALRVGTLEMWIQDHNNNGSTLTFILPPRPRTFNLADYLSPAVAAEENQIKHNSEEKYPNWPFPVDGLAPERAENFDVIKDPKPLSKNGSRGTPSRQAPKINFIRNRTDIQEDTPTDTYDRVKKSFS